jgi:hypothetical protein
MSLFMPIYESFHACLKRVVLMPAYGPRPRPKSGLTLKYFVSCRACAVLFFPWFRPAIKPGPMYTYTHITHDVPNSCLKKSKDSLSHRALPRNFTLITLPSTQVRRPFLPSCPSPSADMDIVGRHRPKSCRFSVECCHTTEE